MVNVRVKRRGTRSRHVWIREMSANDPLTKRRNGSTTTPKPGSPPCPGSSMEGTYLLAMRGPAFRRHDSYLGFRTELENRVGDVKGKGASGRPTRPKVRMHRSGAHCLVRAMKRGNARGAKGAVIHVKMESTGNRKNSSLGGSPAGLPWGGTSWMRREFHVRICEGLGVKFPGPTRLVSGRRESVMLYER